MDRSTTEQATEELTFREAKLPPKLREVRAKLSAKAKQEKRYRFYSLYGLVSDRRTLEAAWQQVARNGGAPGVDRVSIEQIEKQGAEHLVEELAKELREKTYRTGAVRRVYIEKANGKLRPLGIPNVRDRVVQAAVCLILEPIFEADFLDCSHGFRPARGAWGALQQIGSELKAGKCEVYDADLAGYFDSIPHEKLVACLRMRIVDGSVLALIEQWLKAPVEEAGECGGGRRRQRNSCGTPQGGVISPLLANIYLHWFDKRFHGQAGGEGPKQWANATLVRYADDFVVLARRCGERMQEFIEGSLEQWLGLKLNREKTRIVNLREPGASLDFLGYTWRWERDLFGRACGYWKLQPSRKSLARERAKLREIISPKRCFQALPELIADLNEHLVGWANYYRAGYPKKAFRSINWHVQTRLRRHLRRRSQRAWRPPCGQSLFTHLERLGLVIL